MKKILVSILSVLMVLALAAPVSAEDAIEIKSDTRFPLGSGNYILNGDVSISVDNISDQKFVADGAEVSIDFNGKNMTLPAQTFNISSYANVKVSNGSITSNGFNNPANALFIVDAGCEMYVESMSVNTDGTAFFVKGDAAKLVISNNSNISGKGFALGTNAGSSDNYNVNIEISNSELKGTIGAGILFNVPGNLHIQNSTIIGADQGLIVRSGNATVESSTIKATIKELYNGEDNYNSGDKYWGSGNAVPVGAVVFGDYSDGESYDNNVAGSSLKMIDVNLSTGGKEVPAIYTYDNKTSANDDDHDDRTLSISGDKTVVTGALDSKETVDFDISGGTYSEKLPEGVVDDQIVQATVGEGDTALYAVGETSIESTSKDNPNAKVTLTNVPAGTVLNLPVGTQVKNDDANGQSAIINGVKLAPNDEIEAPTPTSEKPSRPTYRPSSPSKDLPSNTKECQKEFGDEYIWSDEYDACVIKFMIVDTSTR